MSFKRYTIEDLEILSAGAEGKAVAKLDGLTIFVPYAVPGDVADVESAIRAVMAVLCDSMHFAGVSITKT